MAKFVKLVTTLNLTDSIWTRVSPVSCKLTYFWIEHSKTTNFRNKISKISLIQYSKNKHQNRKNWFYEKLELFVVRKVRLKTYSSAKTSTSYFISHFFYLIADVRSYCCYSALWKSLKKNKSSRNTPWGKRSSQSVEGD